MQSQITFLSNILQQNIILSNFEQGIGFSLSLCELLKSKIPQQIIIAHFEQKARRSTQILIIAKTIELLRSND